MRSSSLPLVVGVALTIPNAHAVDPFATHNPAHIAGERAAYIDASAFMGNDILPIKTLLQGDKWTEDYHPKSGNNIAVAAARMETGIEWHSLRIGYVARQEWFARADRDSLDLYRSQQLKQPFEANRNYKILYELEGFAAQGIQAGGAMAKTLGQTGWKLDMGLSLSLLKGQRLRREAWQGSATGFPGSMALIDASIERDYDRMSKDLLRSPVSFPASADGNGYAIDAGFSLGREDGLRLDWAVSDLAGRLYWQNVPSESLSLNPTLYCAKADVTCLDTKLALGDKLPTGTIPRPRDLTLHLHPKQMLTLSIPVNMAHVELADSYRDGEHFPRIGVRQQLRAGWGTRLDYDFRMHSVGLALAHRWLYLNYQTDAIRPDKAKVLGLGLGVRIPF